MGPWDLFGFVCPEPGLAGVTELSAHVHLSGITILRCLLSNIQKALLLKSPGLLVV